MTTMIRIRSLTASAIVVAATVTLAACSTGTGGSSAPSGAPIVAPPAPVSIAPIDTPSPEPSMSEAASSGEPSAEATAIATSIDPCTIVTVDEVNKLTGASFSSGKEETGTNNVKRCTYGQQGVVFTVVAAEIGRASCRERVWGAVGAGARRRKKRCGRG